MGKINKSTTIMNYSKSSFVRFNKSILCYCPVMYTWLCSAGTGYCFLQNRMYFLRILKTVQFGKYGKEVYRRAHINHWYNIKLKMNRIHSPWWNLYEQELLFYLSTLSSQVSTESLYGTNLFLFFPAPWSAKAEMTKPRVLRDLEKETQRAE